MAEESLLENTETTEDEAPALERPEWLQDKYMTEDRSMEDSISEQAKAYVESQKMLGGFTGAPEEYEFAIPEGIEGEVDTDLEIFKQFTEIAKSKNINQETAQELFGIFANYQYGMMNQGETDKNNQIAELGPQAQQRLQAVDRWSNANLSPEENDTLLTMTSTADQISLIEKLTSMSKDTPLPKTHGEGATVQTGYTMEDFARDAASPEYTSDPEFRKSVLRKIQG